MIWVNFFHWYQPSWQKRSILDRVTRESYAPFVEFLTSHPKVFVTLNITGSLTELLHKTGQDEMLEKLKLLAERGQVEFVGTAAWHPILPLVPDEIERQITTNSYINQDVFGVGYRPKGFFPPEMCWSKALETLVAQHQFSWLILDEIAYDGTIGHAHFDCRYHSGVEQTGVVFRQRGISNYLSFAAPVHSPTAFWEVVGNDPRCDHYLVTAMDGENLGHHRKGVDVLWQELVTDHRVTTATVSQYRAMLEKEQVCTPVPSSWSSEESDIAQGIPYALWQHPDNALHEALWKLLVAVKNAVDTCEDKTTSEYAEARLRLDRALASDTFWWASGHPWWSAEIVRVGAKQLTEVIQPLTANVDTAETVQSALSKVLSLVQEWQTSGIPATLKHVSANPHDVRPYLGGRQVS